MTMPDQPAPQIGGDHYAKRAIQPIHYIDANSLGFAEGSVVKYVTRWRDKGGVEDLRKARWYIDHLIQLETGAATSANGSDEEDAAAESSSHPVCGDMSPDGRACHRRRGHRDYHYSMLGHGLRWLQ